MTAYDTANQAMQDTLNAIEASETAAEATIRELRDKLAEAEKEAQHQRENKDEAYRERNHLVALLATMFPSGTARTDIEGWNPEWHGCVYIDFPWGQASWHYHDSQAYLFADLPPYQGEWDGHTTEQKYAAIFRHAAAFTLRAEAEKAREAAFRGGWNDGRYVLPGRDDTADDLLRWQDAAWAAYKAEIKGEGRGG